MDTERKFQLFAGLLYSTYEVEGDETKTELDKKFPFLRPQFAHVTQELKVANISAAAFDLYFYFILLYFIIFIILYLFYSFYSFIYFMFFIHLFYLNYSYLDRLNSDDRKFMEAVRPIMENGNYIILDNSRKDEHKLELLNLLVERWCELASNNSSSSSMSLFDDEEEKKEEVKENDEDHEEEDEIENDDEANLIKPPRSISIF